MMCLVTGDRFLLSYDLLMYREVEELVRHMDKVPICVNWFSKCTGGQSFPVYMGCGGKVPSNSLEHAVSEFCFPTAD